VKRQWLLLAVLAFAVVGLMNSPSQAVFIQCPLGGGIGGECDEDEGVTDGPDIIMGTPGQDDVDGLEGGDVIFGGAEADRLEGDEGNDVIFGGPGSDVIRGDDDHDVIVVGPDDEYFSQKIRGRSGNDSIHVFAGDVTTCLFIDPGEGIDTVNLIGFGPFRIDDTGGTLGFAADSVIHLIDPIGGGDIFIEVDSIDINDDTEIINGLPTPNPSIIDEDDDCLCTCPPIVDGSNFF
jgi:hypothetical protein